MIIIIVIENIQSMKLNHFIIIFNIYRFEVKTDYSSDQLNSILNNKINGRNSVMTNSAGLFLNYQNQYGVNAMLAIGVAAK